MKSIFALAPIALLGFAIVPGLLPPSADTYVQMAVSTEGAAQQSAGTSRKLPDCSDGELCMVMVDQDKLSSDQKTQFGKLLETANFPPTSVGKECKYYGKPSIWCLILPPPKAGEVYAQLQQFDGAAANKAVRRFHGAKGGG